MKSVLSFWMPVFSSLSAVCKFWLIFNREFTAVASSEVGLKGPVSSTGSTWRIDVWVLVVSSWLLEVEVTILDDFPSLSCFSVKNSGCIEVESRRGRFSVLLGPSSFSPWISFPVSNILSNLGLFGPLNRQTLVKCKGMDSLPLGIPFLRVPRFGRWEGPG